MKKALITGFGPFGPYRTNPTAEIVRSLDGNFLAGHQIVGKEIPTDMFPCTNNWRDIGESMVLALEPEVTVIVSLGLDSAARGFKIVSVAQNLINNGAYCPELAGLPVLGNRASEHMHSLPLKRFNIPGIMCDWDVEHIPFERDICASASGYCCNALAYEISDEIAFLDLDLPYMLCHLPVTPELAASIPGFGQTKARITKQQIVAGLASILLNYD